MDIRQAKDQIKYAMTAYFSKDEFGNYRLPIEQQRPVFLMGAPGVGKTAIVKQLAQELDVGFVSYSMTHHTRQSALGLPFITKKTFGGVEYDVSEYTMSEIIAAVYEEIEVSGKEEGILFLDEVNCVSETLNPAMLQFLQYKVFGRHRVPEGWIVVTAGNPVEYNRTARDFDIAMWDRLKRIDVEPDYEAWRAYAVATGVHPAVITYLDIERGHFYRMETTIDGATFVTARGWDDLSSMLHLAEASNLPVDEMLVGQYIQDEEIARRFSAYYALFTKYRSDYQIDAILEGNADAGLVDRAKAAPFDERVSLVGLVADGLDNSLRLSMREEKAIALMHGKLAELRDAAAGSDVRADLSAIVSDLASACRHGRATGSMSDEDYFVNERAVQVLGEISQMDADKSLSFDQVKSAFAAKVGELDQTIQKTSGALDNAFAFIENAFGEDQEMLMLVTDVSVSRYGMEFINAHGCDRYFKHSQSLQFYERGSDLARRIGQLDFEDESA